MQPPGPTAPVQHGQSHGGGRLQRRVVAGQQPQCPGGGHIPQLPGGGHIPQWTGGDHIPFLTSGGSNLQRSCGDDLDLPGDVQGAGQPRPPTAARYGNGLDSLSAYPSSDDPSAALEQVANGNPFVNGCRGMCFV